MLLFEVLACGRQNGQRMDSSSGGSVLSSALGRLATHNAVHRLDARREPRLLQTALSGTNADLSQALSQQLCFWTPYGHAKIPSLR